MTIPEVKTGNQIESLAEQVLPEAPALTRSALALAKKGRWGLSSTPETGAMLRTLATSKPHGRFLELGTGVGAGAGWILDGMDANSSLTTIELFPGLAKASNEVLQSDRRVTVLNADVADWIDAYDGPPYDLIFVDTTAAKFSFMGKVIDLLSDGGLLVADDLTPQPKWTEQHPDQVAALRESVMKEPRLSSLIINWASGLLIAARRPRG